MRIYLFLLLLVSSMSFAGATSCNGTVEKIGLHSPDKILLKLSDMNTPVFICNTNATWTVPGTGYTTEPETCKTMISMFMHAKATDIEIGVTFDG